MMDLLHHVCNSSLSLSHHVVQDYFQPVIVQSLVTLLTVVGLTNAIYLDKRQTITITVTASSATVPDYFQTTPELFPGPTATGTAPFLAATNPAPFGDEASFVPPQPLETALPIAGNTNNTSIFQYMGNLSPYFPSPGFGADEYPLPPGAKISQVQMIHRHGSRYPTAGSGVARLGAKIEALTANGAASFSGNLSFLNTWKYQLGNDILVPKGRQELYDSGVQQYYQFARLYNTSSKVIVRTTTQDRMVKSAENFAAGFWGLEWTNNATLELIIDQTGYNNSLAGYNRCRNSYKYLSKDVETHSVTHTSNYLKNAQIRLQSLTNGYTWTIADIYNMQTLCPYETIAYGYSAFCTLFAFTEWEGFEYSHDLQFDRTCGFASPTGRAIGIGWVEEFYARLQGHLYDLPPGSSQVNTTLDEMESTFPLNQSLYFDFSHDVNIAAVITAFGLTQFNQTLTPDSPPANQQMIVSHMTPFGARLIIELIEAPGPILAKRPGTNNASMSSYYNITGAATSYIHFMLNQRTVPLNASYPQCGARDDGWCELSTFVTILDGLLEAANYEYVCFGSHAPASVGTDSSDGTPPPRTKRALGGGMGTGLELKRRLENNGVS